MVGRIYLAKIYFTDLSEYKIRPVVVIREYGDDSVCLPLTSNLEHDGIVVDSDDLGEGYLKKESKVIFPKCFTLHRSILIKHIATVKAKKLSAIHDEFCKKMGCGRGAKTSEFAHGSSLMPKPDRVEISLDPINQTGEGQRQVRASAGIQSVAKKSRCTCICGSLFTGIRDMDDNVKIWNKLADVLHQLVPEEVSLFRPVDFFHKKYLMI